MSEGDQVCSGQVRTKDNYTIDLIDYADQKWFTVSLRIRSKV
jgi:hypothetical protein